MSVQNLEISNESLLHAVAQLPSPEFTRFWAEVERLRRTETPTQPQREINLIKKVNAAVLSDSEQKRFYELIEKRQAESISDEELAELIALTDKSEALNVKRLKYLVQLAGLRRKTLREVMRELEIAPPSTL